MCTAIIQNGIIINEVENALEAIACQTGRKVNDIGIIQRFVNSEKATMFYLDKKLNSKGCQDRDTEYLWIDTGYRNDKGQPIFIELKKTGFDFVGHYAGTMRTLANRMKSYNSSQASAIEKNYKRFIEKYQNKIKERENQEIGYNETAYYIKNINDTAQNEETEFSRKLGLLGLTFETEDEAEVIEEAEESKETIEEVEREITIGLLLDKIDTMQEYINELLTIIETNEKQSNAKIKELQTKNLEYSQSLMKIRTFMKEEAENTSEEIDETKQHFGHNLLGRNNKILVLGATDINVSVMKSIAKNEFGFDKNDLEFEVDYKKIVNDSRRIQECRRYSAIILGCVPHKVASLGSWNSILEKFKGCIDMPMTFDARNQAGGLKVTKESFRTSLRQVYEYLARDTAA